MGLFRRKQIMADYSPLTDVNEEAALQHLAHGVFNDSLDKRNAFANGLLAWAESRQSNFQKYRDLVFQTEFAICAKDWTRRYPNEDIELASAKIIGVFMVMSQQLIGKHIDASNYQQHYGPDIPLMINKAYQFLVDAKEEPGSK